MLQGRGQHPETGQWRRRVTLHCEGEPCHLQLLSPRPYHHHHRLLCTTYRFLSDGRALIDLLSGLSITRPLRSLLLFPSIHIFCFSTRSPICLDSASPCLALSITTLACVSPNVFVSPGAGFPLSTSYFFHTHQTSTDSFCRDLLESTGTHDTQTYHNITPATTHHSHEFHQENRPRLPMGRREDGRRVPYRPLGRVQDARG